MNPHSLTLHYLTSKGPHCDEVISIFVDEFKNAVLFKGLIECRVALFMLLRGIVDTRRRFLVSTCHLGRFHALKKGLPSSSDVVGTTEGQDLYSPPPSAGRHSLKTNCRDIRDQDRTRFGRTNTYYY